MRLGPRWSPEPDLLVIRNEGLHRLTPQRLEGPADLVLEIVSPGTDHLLRAEKLPQYREVRIPEIWVVDPVRKEVRRESFQGDGYEAVAVAAGRVDSAVLPGFWLDAGWLLGPGLPSALECLGSVLGEPG
jgi:Uma2 family endonuclease